MFCEERSNSCKLLT